jgi:hypothetical protein
MLCVCVCVCVCQVRDSVRLLILSSLDVNDVFGVPGLSASALWCGSELPPSATLALLGMHMHAHTHTHTCICIRVHTHVHACVRVGVRFCRYTRAHRHTHVCAKTTLSIEMIGRHCIIVCVYIYVFCVCMCVSVPANWLLRVPAESVCVCVCVCVCVPASRFLLLPAELCGTCHGNAPAVLMVALEDLGTTRFRNIHVFTCGS